MKTRSEKIAFAMAIIDVFTKHGFKLIEAEEILKDLLAANKKLQNVLE